MLRQYFNCNERLEIFLTFFCNILCYVGGEVLVAEGIRVPEDIRVPEGGRVPAHFRVPEIFEKN